MGCGTAQEIAKRAFYALPDLDAPAAVHEARESLTEDQVRALQAKFTPKQRVAPPPRPVKPVKPTP